MSEARKGQKKPPRSKEHRRKLSEANRHPDYTPTRDYFFSLSPEMSLTEKRRLMYSKFPHISERAIRNWIRKWVSTA